MAPVLFVVSTSSMMILDQRTLNIKYRVPASDIVRISLSPFLDDIAVFHVKSVIWNDSRLAFYETHVAFGVFLWQANQTVGPFLTHSFFFFLAYCFLPAR